MSSSEDRQKKKISIARIILWTVVVLFFLIPYDHGVVKDGGSRDYSPFFPWYNIRKVHRLKSPIDEQTPAHEYVEGYEISLFSFVVYSNAH